MNYMFCNSAPIHCKIFTTFGDLGAGKRLTFLSEFFLKEEISSDFTYYFRQVI